MNVMSYAAAVARLRGNDSTRFTPYELVYMATMGGARALDMEDQIGSLEVGKKADIIVELSRVIAADDSVNLALPQIDISAAH